MATEEAILVPSSKLVDHVFNLAKALQGAQPGDIIHFNNQNTKAALDEFLADPLPATLFVFKLESQWLVTSSMEEIEDPKGTLVVIKDKGTLTDSVTLDDQIQVFNIPKAGSSFQTLRSLITLGVGNYFDAITSSSKAENISSTKKKINELGLLLQHLEQSIQVPDLSITLHPTLNEAIKNGATLQNYNELLSDNVLLDPSFLNSLQNIVNGWVKSIQDITKINRDVSEGSAFDEINFWISMETTLQSIQEQIDSVGVQLTLEVLKYAKRYHATVGFLSDVGIKDAMALAADYNKLMKDLPLNQLLASESFPKIEEALILIMNHLKRIRLTSYPVSRALPFVEAISADLEQKLRPMLLKLMSLGFKEFQGEYSQLESLFETWDKLIKEFTNIARELMRKRGEKFIFVKVNLKTTYLKERLDEVLRFRSGHEDFIATLDSTSLSQKDLDRAYDAVRDIDVFESEKVWLKAKKLYDQIIQDIEAEIVDELRKSLDGAKNSNELFRVFENHRNLIERPRIRGAIQEYQSQLLSIIKSEINSIQESFSSKDGINAISVLHDYPEVPLRLLWGKQIQDKISFLVDRLELVFGKDWTSYADGQKIHAETTIMKKRLKLSEYFDNWLSSAAEYRASGEVFRLVKENGIFIQLNFEEHLMNFFKEVRALSWQGFQIPHFILSSSRQIRKVYPHAVILKESLSSLTDLLISIDSLNDLQILLLSEKNELLDTLSECFDVRWDDLARAYDLTNIDVLTEEQTKLLTLQKLEGLIASISRKFEHLKTHLDTLNSSFTQLESLDLEQESIASVIDEIQKCLNQLSFEGHSNVDVLVSGLNKKLAKRLIQLFVKKAPTLVSSNHQVVIQDKLFVSPPLEETKVLVISRLQEATQVIFHQCALREKTLGETREGLYFEDESLIWQKIDEVVESTEADYVKATEFLDRWNQFQVLWDLNSQSIYDSLPIERWLELFDEVKKSKDLFDTPIPEARFGSFVVQFGDARDVISAKFSSWNREILLGFATVLSECIKNTHTEIIRGRKSLESKEVSLSSVTDTVELLSSIQKQKQIIESLEGRLKLLASGESLLFKSRFRFSDDHIFVEQIQNDFQALKDILTLRTRSISSHLESITKSIQIETQRLQESIAELQSSWPSSKPIDDKHTPKEAFEVLSAFDGRLDSLKKRQSLITDACVLLSLPLNIQGDISFISEELTDLKSVWIAIQGLWDTLQELRTVEWNSLKPRHLRKQLDELIANTRAMPVKVRQHQPFQKFLKVTMDLSNSQKTILLLKEDYVRERHLKSLFAKVGKAFPSQLTVGSIWDINLVRYDGLVREVVAQANSERAIEESLQVIEENWDSLVFELFEFNNKRMVKNFPALLETASGDLASLSSMKNSPVYKVFEKEIYIWEQNLDTVSQVLDSWLEVQRQWIDLDGIFDAKSNISSLLAAESSRFHVVSSEFISTIEKLFKSPIVMQIASNPELTQLMRRLSDSFSKISKALGDFLEKQRQLYPRFYFIGNEDLLEILGNMGDVERISRHFKKMFSGVSGITLDKLSGAITAVNSKEGEELVLKEKIVIQDYERLDEWMHQLDYQIKFTLSSLLSEALVSSNRNSLTDLLETYPLQVVLLATQVLWTKSTEHSLIVGDFASQIADVEEQLEQLGRCDSTKNHEALIIELVHQKDVISELSLHNVKSVKSFRWLSEQRFYHDDSVEKLSSVVVKQSTKCFTYGFEYMGSMSRLVYTPLLIKCFVAMTGALEQGLGGSPFGPAGTGKTETVKALAQNLGKMVFVFNCDESFDYQAVGRLLSGICQVGAWGCFDEFNRLDKNILSAVSSQIEQIETGLKSKLNKVELLDKTVPLAEGTGIFVTMNPNYTGRSQLPENLKNLFRSFSMAKPDSEIICEVLLRARKFGDAITLSKRVVDFFSKLENNTSQQKHYDFGLRAIKSTLENARKIRQKAQGPSSDHSVILKSIREMVLPRLVRDDIEVFDETASLVFTGVEPLDDESTSLEVLKSCALAKGLVPTADWLNKALELLKIQETQQGVVIVGESGSGKTAIWSIALAALSSIENSESMNFVIDPKVISKTELFGYLDPITREWIDGLFTAILRRIIEDLRGESKKRTWIIFDGDVDPVWVETLNSVLDDNKTLTLPNGERLKIPENVRFIFEVDNLQHATPATISRCGMVWIEKGLVAIGDLFKAKMPALSNIVEKSELGDEIGSLFIESIEALLTIPVLTKLLERSLNSTSHSMKVTESSLLERLFVYLEAIIPDFTRVRPRTEVVQEYFKKKVLLAVIWSFSGSSNISQRQEFANFASSTIQDHTIVQEADTSMILDYDVSEDAKWIQLLRMVRAPNLEPQSVTDPNVVIETVDTLRHENIIYSVLACKKPLILCGPPGSGKTMTLYSALARSPEIDICNMNFSKETDPESVLKSLEQWCEYKRTTDGYIFRPKSTGKRVVLFADEINLPKKDEYGTQKVIAFLRQLIEKNGFWKSSTKQWVAIQDVQIVGACNPPTDAGRFELSQRFLSHVPVLMVDYPSPVSLNSIYKTFVSAVLQLTPHLSGYSQEITNTMMEVYLKSSQKFTSDIQQHYIYSPRELTRWVRGIFSYLMSNIDQSADLDLESLVKILAYEALRLFSDRLTSRKEKDWTSQLIKETIKSQFPNISADEIVGTQLLFSDWLSLSYQEVDPHDIRSFLRERLNVFADEVLDVNLVLYDEAVDHILRIDRVLKQPQGHMILVGPSGSGKTTLTKFVAWMNGLKIKQLSVDRNYKICEFDQTLKDLLRSSGVQGEKTCFIVDESTILEGSFLERMNSLLANSQIQEIFDQEEYTLLLNACREQVQMTGLLLDTDEELYSWFTQQVAMNLHVVFTISDPNNPDSPQIISSPALFNRCVLNWMGDWTEETVTQLCQSLLRGVPMDNAEYIKPESSSDNQSTSFREAFSFVIRRINSQMSTNKSSSALLELLSTFTDTFTIKERDLEEEQRRVNSGIVKLKETVLKVKYLKDDFSKKQVELKQKELEAKAMLNKILTEQNDAERKQEASVQIQAALERQNVAIEKRRALVMQDLELAEPAILQARRGVKNIKKQHLTELRSMSSPPNTVKLTLESVCAILGYNFQSWRDIQLIIRKDDFITNIVNFDCEQQLTPELRQFMEDAYLSREDYNYDAADRASKACGPLLQWVEAQVKYSIVLDKVGPLKVDVENLELEAAQNQARLSAIDDMIRELEESIENYKAGYTELIREAENVKAEMKLVEGKVDRATKLVESLTSERLRWDSSIKNYEKQRKTLAGNSLLSGAFMTYLGNWDQKNREQMMKTWESYLVDAGIDFDPQFKFTDYMNTPSNLLKWEASGLSNDIAFLQNVSILENTKKIPLIIDPLGQLPAIIQKKLSLKKVTMTSFLDDGFSRTLENSLRFGGTLIVLDAESFDPIIAPLLNNDFQSIGGRTLVKIGKKDVDYSKDFEIILHTEDRFISISPFVAARTSILDFSVSESSLESRTLSMILSSENPEVDSQRLELIQLNSEYKVKLRVLEERLLVTLSESDGELLENNALIESLENLKLESFEVATKMKETETVMHQILDITSKFNPFSRSASLLFKLVNFLEDLNPIYQFSLTSFIGWLTAVLNVKEKTSIERVSYLIKELYREVFANVSIAMTQSDKQLFGLVLSLLYVHETDSDTFSSFVEKLIASSLVSGEAKVSKLKESFGELSVDIISSLNASSLNDFDVDELFDKLNELQVDVKDFKSIIAIAFSQELQESLDGSFNSVTEFLKSGSAPFSSKIKLSDVTEDSFRKPIILLSQRSYDPSFKVVDCANQLQIPLKIVSLGSKESLKIANREISKASKSGTWVLIQNVQTTLSLLESFEKSFDSSRSHENFRLFFTCDCKTTIPSITLRKSSLVMFETPPGVKTIMNDYYKRIGNAMKTSKPFEKSHVYFLLCWLHSVLLERSRLVPQGFSKVYDFNEADFETSTFLINSWFNQSHPQRDNVSPDVIDWEAIQFLLGEIAYGGKVDKAEDSQILKSIVNKLFTAGCFDNSFNLLLGSEALAAPEGHAEEDYNAWIDRLPELQPSSWIGLASDAETLVKKTKYQEILKGATEMLKKVLS